MYTLNRKNYLMITVFALILGVVFQQVLRASGPRDYYVNYYLPMFFLLIPSIAFWISQKEEILQYNSLKLLTGSYVLGVSILIIIGLYKISNLGDLPISYGMGKLIVYGISASIIAGAVWYLVEGDFGNTKISYFLIALTFVIFMLSDLRGFYFLNGDIYSFGAPFLKMEMIQFYVIENGKFILVYLSFPFSVLAKYLLLDW